MNARAQVSGAPPPRPDRTEPSLPVYVIATTDQGTQAAIREASTCAHGLRAHVVVLVPHVVPRVLPLDSPPASPSHAGRRLRDIVERMGIDAEIHVCVCRSMAAVVADLPPDVLVLV